MYQRNIKYLSAVHNLQEYKLNFSLVIDTKMTSRELLSAHKTIATFDGIKAQKCLHYWRALFPDRCSYIPIATFSIKKVFSEIDNLILNIIYDSFIIIKV